MEMFRKKHLKELAKVHQPHCVSMYIPTLVKGDPQVKQPRTLYRNGLKLASKKLQASDLNQPQIDEYLEMAYFLLEDQEFWKYMSDGLAVFIYDNTMDYFRVPVDFEEQTYVADHLFLKPLLPVMLMPLERPVDKLMSAKGTTL